MRVDGCRWAAGGTQMVLCCAVLRSPVHLFPRPLPRPPCSHLPSARPRSTPCTTSPARSSPRWTACCRWWGPTSRCGGKGQARKGQKKRAWRLCRQDGHLAVAKSGHGRAGHSTCRESAPSQPVQGLTPQPRLRPCRCRLGLQRCRARTACCHRSGRSPRCRCWLPPMLQRRVGGPQGCAAKLPRSTGARRPCNVLFRRRPTPLPRRRLAWTAS